MVNIQTSSGFIAETSFEGAYEKRAVKRDSQAAAKAYKQAEKTSVQEHLGEGVSITISPESQEFISGVEERKVHSGPKRKHCGSSMPRIPLRIVAMHFPLPVWRPGSVWRRNRHSGAYSARACINMVSMTI